MHYLIITGTGRGIGKALAEAALLNKDFFVIGLSRSNLIHHPNFKFITLNLENNEEILNFKFDNFENLSSITLVNNAGILGEIDRVGETSDAHYSRVIQTNLTSPSILINKFLKAYKNIECQKTIINISSGASTSAYESWAAYCASKAGLEMFSKVLEKELPADCRVYSIAPGVVDTDMQANIRKTNKDKFIHIDKFLDLKSNGSLYQPKDVANKIFDTILHPINYENTIFRIII